MRAILDMIRRTYLSFLASSAAIPFRSASTSESKFDADELSPEPLALEDPELATGPRGLADGLSGFLKIDIAGIWIPSRSEL